MRGSAGGLRAPAWAASPPRGRFCPACLGAAAMSLQTRQVRANLVRAAYCYKSPEGKMDAATGKEKERKTKWDKRFIIVSETTPAGVYWYKNESVRKAARCLR